MEPDDQTRFNAAAQATLHAMVGQTLPLELFANFLALSSDAVVAVDDAQRIIFFNASAERIFGWTADEIGGKDLSVLLPERHRRAHGGHVRAFGAAHGRARQMGEREQICGRRKSGEEFPAEASVQQIRVGERQIFAAMLRDISPRQRAEEALQHAVQARDDMIGIVSHDLRNPASAVKMLARSIISDAERAGLPADVVQRVEVMHQAAVQIDNLIQDLLDVTRIEARRLTVTTHPVSVRELVDDALIALRPLADARGIAMDASYDDDLPDVLADGERIGQLFSNLVGNALKFTAEGGQINIRALRDGAMVELRVRDTGVGIPPEQLPHVFDRFFQGSQGSGPRRHGSGLGLPIARGIAEAHGGQIWIDSVVNEGTTVHVTVRAAS